MTAGAARRRPSARLLIGVGLPALIAVATCAAVLQYPTSDVPGGVAVGVRGLAAIRPVVLGFRPSVSWASGRHHIVLTVHPDARCPVALDAVTSTAPGRLEVRATDPGAGCARRRTTQRFDLPLPVVPDPRRTVRIEIDHEVLRLRWSPVPPHPAGVSDF